MEDTFFTGRALSKNFQDVIFLALRRTYKTPAFFFQDVTVFFNTLGVLIQETLWARFGLNKEFKCRR